MERYEGSLSRFLVVWKLAGRHSVRVQGEKEREDDGERQRERRACGVGICVLCANVLAEHCGGRGRGGEGE